jgi:hypothetical protein
MQLGCGTHRTTALSWKLLRLLLQPGCGRLWSNFRGSGAVRMAEELRAEFVRKVGVMEAERVFKSFARVFYYSLIYSYIAITA